MPLQTAWTNVLNKYSPAQIEFFGNVAVQLACFWLPAAVYVSLPSLFPNWSSRHKLQKDEKQPTKEELKECLTLVLRNQMLSTLLHLSLLSLSVFAGQPPSYRFDAKLPSFTEVAREFVLCSMMREVLFYYLHRVLHHPSLYPNIHKRHHRLTAPVALAAQYVPACP